MGTQKKPIITGISSQFTLSPAEAPAMLGKKNSSMHIGIPKSEKSGEKRVPLTPTGVAALINNGHKVTIESNAGMGAQLTDHEYSEAGAVIAYSKEQVYEAQIILKMEPPFDTELNLLKPGHILISPIQLSTLKPEIIRDLIRKRVIALAFEYVKDDSGNFPFVRSMSEIAGDTAILIGSEYLSQEHGGKGILLGGISGVAPAKVVILGAGVVGEFAARTALGLGADVRVFDNNIYKLMRLQNNIGRRVFTSILNQEVLFNEITTADVAVGAIHSDSGLSPVIVTEEMVSKMKPGSVIIDVSIDQGGVFETSKVTTHTKPVYKLYDVIHYCVPNIPSRVSGTASRAISNILSPMLMKAGDLGGIEDLMRLSPNFRHGVYVYKGCLCNRYISERFGLKYTELDLLFTSGL